MPPTPTSGRKSPDAAFAIPPLHLRCLRLEECNVFFEHTATPDAALRHAVSNVLRLLYPAALLDADSFAAPAPVRSVTLHLRSFDGVAYTCGSDLDNEHKELHLSMSYLEGVLSRSNGDAKRVEHEIDGVLTHELVHAFQYDARGSLPGGLVEGIADWVRGEAGLAPPHWREQPGECDRWDTGYERTGFFLSFLSRHFRDPLLVPKINLAARSDTWDDGALLRRVLGGEDVEDLWALYKRTFGDKDQGTDDAPAPVPTHGARSGYGVGY